MNETQEAKCKDCGNRRADRFCLWLQAFLEPGVIDDPNCEGFTPKNVCPKSPQKEMTETLIPSTQDSKDPLIACPKTQQPNKELVQTALSIKLKGSIVFEKVNCGKLGCRCQNGALHGPYAYLHYYSCGKVRRKYLSTAVAELMSFTEDELEKQLREAAKRILGQGSPSGSRLSETSGGV